MKMKELKDTVKPMLSKNYKKRFKAEYAQLKIRTSKLDSLLEDMLIGKLSFVPDSDFETLFMQYQVMRKYLEILEHRAELEGIKL